MVELDSQMHWVIGENVARYQEMLKSETDACRRKMLEEFLLLEREKLKATPQSPPLNIRRNGRKGAEHDQSDKEQDDATKKAGRASRKPIAWPATKPGL